MLTTIKSKSRVISLQERIQTDTTGKIDRKNGVIRGVKILGKISKNGREYSEAAMNQAAKLYEGVRVNFDHPDRATPNASRSVKDWIGELRNVRKSGDGVYGDLHLIKSHPHAAAVMEAAEKFPTKFGLSHNAAGPTRRDGNKTIVEGIQSVNSVDLVQNPATNNSLFESVQGDRTMKTQATSPVARMARYVLSKHGLSDRVKLHRLNGVMRLTESMDGSPETSDDPVTSEPEDLRSQIQLILDRPTTNDADKLRMIRDIVGSTDPEDDETADTEAPVLPMAESYDSDETKRLWGGPHQKLAIAHRERVQSGAARFYESLTGQPLPGSQAAAERQARIKSMTKRYQ